MFNLLSNKVLKSITKNPYPNGCILTAAATAKLIGGRVVTGEALCEMNGKRIKIWHTWSTDSKGNIVDNHQKYFDLSKCKVIKYYPDRVVSIFGLDNCPSGQLKRFMVQWYHNQEVIKEIYDTNNLQLLNDFCSYMNGDILKEDQPANIA